MNSTVRSEVASNISRVLALVLSWFLFCQAPLAGAESLGDPGRAATAIRQGAYVLDVRSEAELSEGAIAGSTLIPHNQLKARLAEVTVTKEAAIVVYCRSGRRASQAEAVLREAGFTNVINGGGYDELEAELRRGLSPAGK